MALRVVPVERSQPVTPVAGFLLQSHPATSKVCSLPDLQDQNGQPNSGGVAMNLSARDYAISAFCDAATNQLDHKIMWAAMALSLSPDGQRTNCKKLDDNISAAIQAGEWLDRAVERYRG